MKKKTQKYLLVALLMFCLLIGIYFIGAYAGLWATGPAEPTVTTSSSWTLIDYTTGEDVSEFIEISAWIDDQDIDETADIYRLSNFDETESSKDAEDVSLDLRDVNYCWIEIDPDTESYYGNDFHLYLGGSNANYTIYVYHMSSTVMMTNIDRATGCACLLSNCTGNAGNTTSIYQGSGNYTMFLDVPLWSADEPHCGSDWNMEDCPPAMDDPDTEDWLITYNERSHRCQAPLYVPGDDDSKEFETHLEQLTDAFVLKITFNATVNCTDGSTNQVNMTIMDELYSEPIELVSCGDAIYVVFYDPIDFFPKAYSFSYEIVFGTTIEWCNIESGRMVIPKGAKACPLGTFGAYHSICQCNATGV